MAQIYKNPLQQAEAIQNGEKKEPDFSKELENSIRGLSKPRFKISNGAVALANGREVKSYDIDLDADYSSDYDVGEALTKSYGDKYWVLRDGDSGFYFLVDKNDAAYDEIYDDAGAAILNQLK